MKKLIFILIAISIGFGDYLPGRMILKIKPAEETICKVTNDGFLTTGIDEVDNLLETYTAKGGKYLLPVREMDEKYASKSYDIRNLFVVYFRDKSLDMEKVSSDFRQLECVIDATPDYLEYETVTTPTDEQYSSQWHLKKIKANYAWDFNTGDSSVIAVHFEAVDWQHPDIAPLLWNNLGEDADGDGVTIERRLNWSFYGNYEYYFDPDDLNGIDDDGNGFVDDLIGWDFIDFTDDPLDEEYQNELEDYYETDNNPYDDVGTIGHGTHVAGTMLGAANNDSIGTVGVAWQGRLMCLKGGYYYMRDGWDLSGTHPHSFSLAAYHYAIMMDAKVWNMSYGGNSYNGLVSSALYMARDSIGAFLSAAAGNEGDSESHYPSGYPGVMAVAASTREDMAADFTTYGARIAICAPGVDIYAPVPLHDAGITRTNPYDAKDGTSMASPVVAGAAILIKAKNPDFLWIDIYALMQEYAVEMPDPLYESDSLGAGRLNLYKSLYIEEYPNFYLDSIAVVPAPGDEDGRIDVGETGLVYVSYSSDPEWQDPSGLTLELSSAHDGIDITVTDISLPDIGPGESVNNFDSPLEFTVNEDLDEGEMVLFNVTLNDESGYFRKDTISEMIGYPHFLIYDRDGGELVENFVFNDLQIGATYYEHYDADLHGPIDRDFLNNNFRIVLFLNGRNDSIPILSEEIDIFSDFLDIPDKCMFLAGQYLADDPSITTFLADYFATEHIEDEIPSRFWGMNTLGVDGDTVGNGMNIDVTMGAGAFGPQTSIGQCEAIGDGVNVFYYDGHPGVYCATRYETPANKTFFTEFSIAGVEGDNPGGNTRFQLLAKVIEWFGLPFTSVDDENAKKPENLGIISYPNPFNSAVEFDIRNAKSGNCDLKIYDTSGRLIETLQTDGQNAKWHPEDANSSGVYIYRASDGSSDISGRVLYIK